MLNIKTAEIIVITVFAALYALIYTSIATWISPEYHWLTLMITVAYIATACRLYQCTTLFIQSIPERTLNQDHPGESQIIAKLLTELETCFDIEEAAQKINQLFSRLFNSPKTSIRINSKFMYARSKEKSEFVITTNSSPKFKKDLSFSSKSALYSIINQAQHFIHINNIPHELKESFQELEASIILPFQIDAQLAGLITLQHSDMRSLEKHVPILDFLRYQIGVVFCRILAHTKLLDTEKIHHQEKLAVMRSLAGSIAHEVRNPLSTVKNAWINAEMTLTESNTLTQQYISHGLGAINRGLQIINMTLDSVNEKPINKSCFVPLSASVCIQKALDEYGYADDIEKNRIHVSIKEDFHFNGEETMFIFVLFNLIKNALYYVHTHAELTIDITAHTLSTTQAEITIRDTGPGIEKEALEKIFTNFYTKGKSGGTGLGLPYCKRIIEAFGGGIVCTSEPGQYTEFKLLCPRIEIDKSCESHKLSDNDKKGIAGKKILFVTSNHTFQRVSNKLSTLPIETLLATSTDELYQNLKQHRLNCVVFDAKIVSPKSIQSTQEKIRRGTNFKVGECTNHKVIPLLMLEKNTSEFSWLIPHIKKQTPNLKTHKTLLKQKTILLVDDSQTNRILTSVSLKKSGVSILEANSGLEAINILSTGAKVDLILMDIQMPGMNGLEATIKIRQYHPHMPIIALTSNDSKEDIETALATGMNDHISKPIDFDSLFVKVIAHLSESPKNISPAISNKDVKEEEVYA